MSFKYEIPVPGVVSDNGGKEGYSCWLHGFSGGNAIISKPNGGWESVDPKCFYDLETLRLAGKEPIKDTRDQK